MQKPIMYRPVPSLACHETCLAKSRVEFTPIPKGIMAKGCAHSVDGGQETLCLALGES